MVQPIELIGEDLDASKIVRQVLWMDERSLVASYDDGSYKAFRINNNDGRENRLEQSDAFRASAQIYEMDVLKVDSDTTLILSTCKDQPVHLRRLNVEKGSLNVLNHHLLCKNHVEEIISPICVKGLAGKRVVTGHMKGLLKLFDLNRPSYEVLSCELKYRG